MQHTIEVENIRCGGCANTISKEMLDIDTIESVDVEIEDQKVIIDTIDTNSDLDDESTVQAAVKALLNLGYPEKGSVEGMDALKGKAKSVVSCAIGKMS